MSDPSVVPHDHEPGHSPPGAGTLVQQAPPLHLMGPPSAAGPPGGESVSRGRAAAPPAPAGAPHIPGYAVGEEIARGGMGVVYAARELGLNREVAVKTLYPERAADPVSLGRFLSEARLTARLPHPNIPPVYALGALADGRPFLAMKLIRGRTLGAILAARWGRPATKSTDDLELTTPETPGLLTVFEQVCQAVAFAHGVGILHRDLKPANVMVGAFGEVQVMDWGLGCEARREDREARGAGAAAGLPSRWESVFPSPRLTRPGAVLGTPAYMPPEQARGEWGRVDARADVFALGALLTVMLTGHPPYTGGSTFQVLQRAASADLGEAFERLGLCGADPQVVGLAKWCLAPDPADRPLDAAAVAGLLEAYRLGVEGRLRRAEAQRAAEAERADAARRRAEVERLAKRAAEERAAAALRQVEAEHRAAADDRRRRRGRAVSAGVILGLAVGGGAFGWWVDRAAEERGARRAEAEAERLRAVADHELTEIARAYTALAGALVNGGDPEGAARAADAALRARPGYEPAAALRDAIRARWGGCDGGRGAAKER